MIRSLLTFSLAAVFSAVLFSNPSLSQEPAKDEAKKDDTKLESTIDKASYGIGFNIGSNVSQDFQRQGLELNPEAVAKGFLAALQKKDSALTEAEQEEVFKALRAEMSKKKTEKSKANLDAGKKYLEDNKAKEGVKVTKSGLQYLVIKEGKGESPTAESTVKTHYRGTLINGKVFDQSYEGEAPAAGDMPVSFPVGQVIPGWTEALQLMKPGAHYRLFIPSELAYGENGPGEIGPNSVLVFEVHLLSVE